MRVARKGREQDAWICSGSKIQLPGNQNSDVSVVQSLSCVRFFATSWTAARQAALSFTISRSLLKLMSIELMMPSKHLILCHPLIPYLTHLLLEATRFQEK